MTGGQYKKAMRIAVAGLALGVSSLPLTAMAAPDPLIDGARLCTQRFPVEEERNKIPTHLLAAISTTESGRWHEGLGMSVPWPWTINVEGRGYYFNSKAEAIAATQKYLAQGKQSIDVGCMQVNLKHHPKAFANLNEAFDPPTNVAYAAKFLHDNYADLGDWIKATAAYHSRTTVYGNQYLAQIEKSWNRIVAKVSSARASIGASGDGAKRGGFDTAAIPANSRAVSNIATRPIASTHNAKIIQVKEVPARNDVLVIRAKPAPVAQPEAAPMKVAEATPVPVAAAPANFTPAPTSATESMIIQGRTDSVRRVSLDKPASSTADTSSKFVFAN